MRDAASNRGLTEIALSSFEDYEELLLGAHIVEVERQSTSWLRLHFEHRGTDDYSGTLIVSLDGVHPRRDA